MTINCDSDGDSTRCDSDSTLSLSTMFTCACTHCKKMNPNSL